MNEVYITQPDTDVQETEYLRLLGYPPTHVLRGRARELADWARQWYAENGNPWLYGRRVENVKVSDGRVWLNGVAFSTRSLYELLTEAEAQEAMLALVSAGDACESTARQLWREEKPDEYFFLEVYGSAVVEHLITVAAAHFCAWAEARDLAVLPHASPGYAGWDIAEQKKLLDLIQQGASQTLSERIRVLDSGMLTPKKSQQAVFGVTSNLAHVEQHAHLVPCARCALQACQYRRTDYRQTPPQLEDVTSLQFSRRQTPRRASTRISGNGEKRDYLASPKALRRWSQERLRLTYGADASVEARFRYEGTTCLSPGHRIEYDYFVKLDASDEAFRVTDLHCGPAPGDTGYAHMCEAREDPHALLRQIDGEKPLLGRPIDEVFDWGKNQNPAGCYCEAASREHKWRLVFEVIHFALSQRQENRAAAPAANSGEPVEHAS